MFKGNINQILVNLANFSHNQNKLKKKKKRKVENMELSMTF